jgi:uncharacterized membrane protein
MPIAALFSLLSLVNLSEVIRSFPSCPLALAGPAWLSWDVSVRYLVALIFTVAGLLMIRKQAAQTGALDRLVPLGPVFVAMPMAVFAFDHFIEARAIAGLVPRWIPGHLFWTYFVGVALLCAAISIVANRYAGLAAALLGVMWVLFEALMHIPTIIRVPHARIAWNIAFRDLSFAGGAFALAATYTEQWRTQGTHRLLWVARLFLGVPVLIFGAQHFIYPLFVPGVPDDRLTPTWMPFPHAWSYATGAIEVATGLCLVINWKARTAALWLGAAILVLVLFFYLPIMVAYASSIDDGLNYFADTLVLSGAALLFAGSQRPDGAIQAHLVSAAPISGN